MSSSGTIGTCFGFAVRSSLPFHYLRGGDGQTIEISAPSPAPDGGAGTLIVEWTPTAELPFEGRLYRDDDRYRLWIAGSGWFIVDPHGPSVVLPDEENVVRREERLWSVPAILCLLARGDLPLHAAAVEVDGEAVLLAAPRTFGKTTLAAAFLSAGYRLLSEDVTCVRLAGVPLVVPGPAMLRVRRDVAEALQIANATPIGEPDDRVHLALDTAARGDCRPLPIRAIVLLRASDDGFRIEPVQQTQAVQDLWWLSSKLPTDVDHARCFSAVVDLAGGVRIYNLFRPLRLEELPATVGLVVGSV